MSTPTETCPDGKHWTHCIRFHQDTDHPLVVSLRQFEESTTTGVAGPTPP